MYNLIVSIVPHDCGELLTNVAKEAGAGGGTIIMGRGTASNGIIQLLGLGDTSKDIVLILVDEPQKEKVLNSIITTCATKKAHFGVLCTVSVNNFIKAGSQMQKVDFNLNHGDESMENSYQMINVIVNKGYAEDAMDAARKADPKWEIGKPVPSRALDGITRESVESTLEKSGSSFVKKSIDVSI